MNDSAQMCVVEIMDVARRRIDKRRRQGIRSFGSTDQGRLPATGKFPQRRQRTLDGAIMRAFEGGSEKIQQ